MLSFFIFLQRLVSISEVTKTNDIGRQIGKKEGTNGTTLQRTNSQVQPEKRPSVFCDIPMTWFQMSKIHGF
jgi:hypothetical protein